MSHWHFKHKYPYELHQVAPSLNIDYKVILHVNLPCHEAHQPSCAHDFRLSTLECPDVCSARQHGPKPVVTPSVHCLQLLGSTVLPVLVHWPHRTVRVGAKASMHSTSKTVDAQLGKTHSPQAPT